MLSKRTIPDAFKEKLCDLADDLAPVETIISKSELTDFKRRVREAMCGLDKNFLSIKFDQARDSKKACDILNVLCKKYTRLDGNTIYFARKGLKKLKDLKSGKSVSSLDSAESSIKKTSAPLTREAPLTPPPTASAPHVRTAASHKEIKKSDREEEKAQENKRDRGASVRKETYSSVLSLLKKQVEDLRLAPLVGSELTDKIESFDERKMSQAKVESLHLELTNGILGFRALANENAPPKVTKLLEAFSAILAGQTIRGAEECKSIAESIKPKKR